MIKTVIASAAALCLSACATGEIGDPDIFSPQSQQAFGKAVNQNIAAQTVNPDGAAGDVEASGARVGAAQERYRQDQVEKPRTIGTRQSGQSGGGEGGGKK
ncbi:MAG: hypothetical protein AB7P23_04255 [Amphiplicatus sp.]